MTSGAGPGFAQARLGRVTGTESGDGPLPPDVLTRTEADGLYRAKSTYVHSQGVAASVWTINHNLESYPIVRVVDSAGTQLEGDVDYVDQNTLTVSFSFSFSGTAYLG